MKPLLLPGLAALCLLAAGCTHTAPSRADFLQLIERPRVSAATHSEDISHTNGLVQLRFTFATEAAQRVPGFLLKRPESHGRRPAVIALHGTGGSKLNVLALARKLATNGFVAVVMDARYHGERLTSGKGTDQYNQSIARAWRQGGEHPLYYDTVWDVMRLVDHLRTREDVDPDRIGLIGISKGGIEAYLAAAVDPRIAATVSCIGVQSFRWGLEHDAWQGRVKTIQRAFDLIGAEAGITNLTPEFVMNVYDRVAPGIYGAFDGPAMLPLIAPRPLLVITGDSDPNTPLPGVLEAAAAARKAYHQAGAADHFELRIQEKTGHQFRPESERAAIQWLTNWLKP